MKKGFLFLAAGLVTLALGAANVGASAAEPVVIMQDEETAQWVIADDENCTFIIKEIIPDGDWGYTWKAYLENKTDRKMMFSMNGASMNGVMCEPFWASEVIGGMKTNEEITWMDEILEDGTLGEVTTVTFGAHVYFEDDWDDTCLDEYFTVNPKGDDAVKIYEHEMAEQEQVLVDNDVCKITVVGFGTNLWDDFTMFMYLENKTDKTLCFCIGDATVNGLMCDPYWAFDVFPGQAGLTGASWSASDFEENDIIEARELSLPFVVYDRDDWMADYLLEETYTVSVW